MTINNFIEELKKIGIELDDEKLNQLNIYYQLLISWNEKMNLTGITKKEDVYLKHFYDSLTLIRAIDLTKINTLCDIGTGAGFPGLVVKIVFPQLNVTLVDSLNKRIIFLNEVIKELRLTNIETKSVRIEEYGITNREKYDVVVARAVAPLPILLEYASPLVKIGGHFIAMKGNNEEHDERYPMLGIKYIETIDFLLPYENSQRTLIKFNKYDKTNKKYPRRYAEIKKKPLQ